MVILIGLVTMTALVGLLVWSLKGESSAERRRLAAANVPSPSTAATESEVPFSQAA